MEKQDNKNPHAGHRGRVKARFLEEGLGAFADHEVLELLLYFGIPQKDTNLLAHQLLEQFGSFRQIFEADYEQLRQIPGMTASAALLLTLIPQLSRRYIQTTEEMDGLLNSTDKIGHFFVSRFMGQTAEEICLLCLDSSCRLVRCETLSEGGVNGFEISPRRIVEVALQCKATNLILAHNHPGGTARPSSQDIRNTQALAPLLQRLRLELLDHFIISGEDYVSMMELGYLGVKKVRERQF